MASTASQRLAEYEERLNALAGSDVVVVTGDAPPTPGQPANGAGIRAAGLTYGLRQLGLRATLLAPEDHLPADSLAPHPGLIRLPREDFWLPGFWIQMRGVTSPAPVVVTQHWGVLEELGLPWWVKIAIDLAGPHLLERRHLRGFDPLKSLHEKLHALAAAHFVQAGGPTQGIYFQALMQAAGIGLPMHLADFCLPTESWASPAPSNPSDLAPFPSTAPDVPWLVKLLGTMPRPVLLMGGLPLPWQDSSEAMHATLDAMDSLECGSIILTGPLAVAAADQPTAFHDRLTAIEQHPRLFRLGLLSFEAMLTLARHADAALDLHTPNAERRLAVPSRTAVHAACGLPALFNDFSDWSSLMGKAVPGWAIGPENRDAITAILNSLRNSPRQPGPASPACAELLSPARNLASLAAFIAETRAGSPDASRPELPREVRNFTRDDWKSHAREIARQHEWPEAKTQAALSSVHEAIDAAWPTGVEQFDVHPEAAGTPHHAEGGSVAWEPASAVRRLCTAMISPAAGLVGLTFMLQAQLRHRRINLQ